MLPESEGVLGEGEKEQPARAARLLERLAAVLHWAGIDRAVALSVAGRGWALVASPVTLLLVGTHLSRQEQGFYYSFANVLGLSVIFELGLSYVVGLLASHERAHLSWTAEGRLAGTATALERLGSLLRGSVLWYGVVGAAIIALVLPAGVAFFGRDATGTITGVQWTWPWAWVAAATALTCLLTPIWNILQGLGNVVEVAQVRLTQQVVGTLLSWAVLLLGWRLFASPVVSSFAVLYGVAWLYRRRAPVLRQLWTRTPTAASVNWGEEVWPLQWRIALSWLSAWYAFQMLSPLMLFRFQGAVLAGQMGMSLTISQALSPMGASWIATKTPAMGTMVAKREYEQLDRMFFRALLQSTAVMVAGGCAVVGCVWLLDFLHHPFANRLLSVGAIACLAAAAVANHVQMAFALYLRSHKREPLVALSALMGLATAISAAALARYSSATAMCAVYLVLTAGVNLLATWRIFAVKRREWHAGGGAWA